MGASGERQLSQQRKNTYMNKVTLLLILFTAIFTGCQIAYVKPTKGEMAGDVTVYQGFSRSAVGAQNTLDADVTKTAAILTADVSPELNSEINPELSSATELDLSSEINPALASEINPEIASEVNPELDTNINAEISDIYKSEAAPIGEEAEPVEEEEVAE